MCIIAITIRWWRCSKRNIFDAIEIYRGLQQSANAFSSGWLVELPPYRRNPPTPHGNDSVGLRLLLLLVVSLITHYQHSWFLLMIIILEQLDIPHDILTLYVSHHLGIQYRHILHTGYGMLTIETNININRRCTYFIDPAILYKPIALQVNFLNILPLSPPQGPNSRDIIIPQHNRLNMWQLNHLNKLYVINVIRRQVNLFQTTELNHGYLFHYTPRANPHEEESPTVTLLNEGQYLTPILLVVIVPDETYRIAQYLYHAVSQQALLLCTCQLRPETHQHLVHVELRLCKSSTRLLLCTLFTLHLLLLTYQQSQLTFILLYILLFSILIILSPPAYCYHIISNLFTHL